MSQGAASLGACFVLVPVRRRFADTHREDLVIETTSPLSTRNDRDDPPDSNLPAHDDCLLVDR